MSSEKKTDRQTEKPVLPVSTGKVADQLWRERTKVNHEYTRLYSLYTENARNMSVPLKRTKLINLYKIANLQM